ncbi:Nociceptin receptor [Trichoplax sp. H2]|nr:Nociceptin receptor [Trichoplax sp. H2]|eukprot:RDD41474.1 Nociceptin receptor [Trichoplax sp. H2]
MDFNITTNGTANNIYSTFIVNLCFSIIALTLNLAVCLIIGTHSKLWQPFNLLILNLSFSDILVSVGVLLNGLIHLYVTHPFMAYATANVLCKISIALAVVALPGASLTLLAMSIERFQAISVIRIRKLGLRTVRNIVIIIWAIAVISIIVPTMYAELERKDPFECAIDRVDNFSLVLFILFAIIANCLIPVTLTFTLYIVIIYKFCLNKIRIQPIKALIIGKRKKSLRQKILPVICISIISALSGIPYLLLHYYLISGQHFNPHFRGIFLKDNYVIWTTFRALFIVTPILNPLLYNLASSKFRNHIRALICHQPQSVDETTGTIKQIKVLNLNSAPINSKSANGK